MLKTWVGLILSIQSGSTPLVVQQEGNDPINLRWQGWRKFSFASYVDPNHLLIHVHIAYVIRALLVVSEATTVSK